MDVSTFPSKGNLINARSSLKLSKNGYELLDKKRNILLSEMSSLVKRAKKIRKEINKVFSEAYKSLQTTNIASGISTVEQVGYAISEENSINVKYKSIMGVEIPVVKDLHSGLEANYSFFRTNYSLDFTYKKFNNTKKLCVELAEVENSIYRLADHIKKTQKRANALKTILIPRYENLVNFMEKYLEEKEREDFSRLHSIKKNLNTT
ncbi:V-type ATP synthase subunit D [Herbivorax sp. ANBcel31]|uniref:V-type ATP synthase subunit D n=1 Tax=Herbivorax sp. ANBcel31 TaxID=3069754 RepID=UPI0027B1D90D|nr:V-type ATP synthase subunit D [Herbivorax sp. ANBcel31]MDQ2087265.1 V-type ATP synthase subunit D [Herbivorax sp. ANBcel31]